MTGHRKLTDEDYETIGEMRERGATYDEIGDTIGCSGSAVSWHALRLGIEPPNPRPLPSIPTEPMVMNRGGFPLRRFTVDEDARLTALSLAGLGESEIARALGRRPNSVRGRLMTLARHDARAEGDI